MSVGNIGDRVVEIASNRTGWIVSGNWSGMQSTFVKFDDNKQTEELQDSTLRVIQDTKVVVSSKCPTCKTVTPHRTVGRREDGHGKFQRMECVVCGTSERVQTGEHGELFQQNVDAPTGME